MIGFEYVPSPLSATQTLETTFGCDSAERENEENDQKMRAANEPIRPIILSTRFERRFWLGRPHFHPLQVAEQSAFAPGDRASLAEPLRDRARASPDKYFGVVRRIV